MQQTTEQENDDGTMYCVRLPRYYVYPPALLFLHLCDKNAVVCHTVVRIHLLQERAAPQQLQAPNLVVLLSRMKPRKRRRLTKFNRL